MDQEHILELLKAVAESFSLEKLKSTLDKAKILCPDLTIGNRAEFVQKLVVAAEDYLNYDMKFDQDQCPTGGLGRTPVDQQYTTKEEVDALFEIHQKEMPGLFTKGDPKDKVVYVPIDKLIDSTEITDEDIKDWS